MELYYSFLIVNKSNNFIIGFGLFRQLVDNKKNIKYCRPYLLSAALGSTGRRHTCVFLLGPFMDNIIL